MVVDMIVSMEGGWEFEETGKEGADEKKITLNTGKTGLGECGFWCMTTVGFSVLNFRVRLTCPSSNR